jgi:ABC-type lipoprotein export system ATPase subunit
MERIIELANVSKSFRSQKGGTIQALRAIDLQVQSGEWVTLKGASGSGKSTLLHVIGGLLSPDAGSISVLQEDPTKLRPGQLNAFRGKNIGFVLQDFALIPNLTGFDNVALPMVFTSAHSSEIKKRVKNILARLGISELSDRLIREMSGGQRQRIAIARALIYDAPLLLADEPTGSLDPDTKTEILEVFRELHAEGKTILFATHDADASAYADREIKLRDGTIL